MPRSNYKLFKRFSVHQLTFYFCHCNFALKGCPNVFFHPNNRGTRISACPGNSCINGC